MLTPQAIKYGRMHRAQHKNVTRWMGPKVVIPETPYKKFDALEWIQILAFTAVAVVLMVCLFFFVY